MELTTPVLWGLPFWFGVRVAPYTHHIPVKGALVLDKGFDGDEPFQRILAYVVFPISVASSEGVLGRDSRVARLTWVSSLPTYEAGGRASHPVLLPAHPAPTYMMHCSTMRKCTILRDPLL